MGKGGVVVGPLEGTPEPAPIDMHVTSDLGPREETPASQYHFYTVCTMRETDHKGSERKSPVHLDACELRWVLHGCILQLYLLGFGHDCSSERMTSG
jgi:hypothetical protein